MKEKKLEEILDEAFRLFPIEIQESELNLNYQRYMFEFQTIFSYVSVVQNINILDIGTGMGITPFIFKKFGFNASAIDNSRSCQSLYEYTFQENYDTKILDGIKDHINILQCNIEKDTLPCADDTFDIVCMLNVIEHLHSSPKHILQEVRRVLKKDGYFFLSTPNLSTLKNRMFVMIGKSNHVPLEYWFNSGDSFPGHIREYTSTEVEQILTWSEFEIVDILFSNCLQIPSLKKNSGTLKKYERVFKINNSERILMSLYLTMTTLFPRLRYYMFAIAKNKKFDI